MTKKQTILLPTDFSDASINAGRYAMKLFKDESSKMVALHVHDPSTDGYDPDGAPHDYGHDRLNAMADSLKEVTDVVMQTMSRTVIKGEAVNQINKHAAQIHADLIVMGTTGASGLKRMFIGSVASRVIKRAPCPVLVVPHHSRFKGIRQIAMAVDLKPDEDVHTYRSVFELIDRYKAELVLFHVSSKVVDAKMKNTHADYPIGQEINKRRHRYVHIKASDPVKAIVDFAKEEEIDLLVMLKHHSRLNGIWPQSSVEKVAMRIDIPLLSLHQPSQDD